MLHALKDGERAEAMPGCRGFCPGCGAAVVARCGEINVWHWAHEARAECDPWFEGESAWHLKWKRHALASNCEVVMGSHRADIVTATGHVIELQHSSLSPEQVRERERFYGNMTWIIDATEFLENIKFRNHGDHWTFRWRHPRQWMFSITQELIWDCGGDGDMLLVKKIHDNLPCGGWGYAIDREDFMKWAFDPASRTLNDLGVLLGA